MNGDYAITFGLATMAIHLSFMQGTNFLLNAFNLMLIIACKIYYSVIGGGF